MVRAVPFPARVKERLLHLRKPHPGWGPDTLLTALKLDPGTASRPLKSRAQLARLLKHAGLTRRYQPHHDLMQPAQSLLDSPASGMADGCGIRVMRVDGVGKVSLISIVDVTSRRDRLKVIPASTRAIQLCRTTS